MAPDKDIHLSPREMEILAKAWQCFDTDPKINWQKLADIAPFKNPQTARACFAPIKKKLAIASGGSTGGGNGEATSPPSTPSKGRGKRKATTAKTPSSGKKAKLSAKPAASSEDDDEEAIKADIKAQNDDEDLGAGDDDAVV